MNKFDWIVTVAMGSLPTLRPRYVCMMTSLADRMDNAARKHAQNVDAHLDVS